ncbi:hydroxymethylglutaryl-CoA synthase [Kocuria sp. HSID16901]|uniref:hydroxymethylglutaryl-CoA synthase n=1 Tax=Kocuria sp. HSID16901 TaxID=2419505 RepID=UPI000AE0E9B0|nr:hydroxymethylglutaryl-CoA synthase [Kocuria sp. HSID16901]MCT1366920.1 hydroxymethylglutaryl-CoA synthase [Rothia sp. p3-SID1597]
MSTHTNHEQAGEEAGVPTAGIQDIAFATGHYSFDLKNLADQHEIDVNKFYVGIGQETMSIPASDEDIVTMGAAAAQRIIERNGTEGIRTLLFATESGIDQSKSAGVYVHGLLKLPREIRTIETKMACYGAIGALQMALGLVARNPKEKVLVIAADVARYDIDTSGEPTQGAAAVAFLVQASPDILAIESSQGVYTSDVQDFWRPNFRNTALVDGKFSVGAYMDALVGAWHDYRDHDGVDFDEIDWFCYHQPFTKMAVKAHMRLTREAGVPLDKPEAAQALEPTFGYNKQLGNSYSASIFLGFLALLDSETDLEGQRVGFFSYGSGAVAEFFTGIIQPGYRKHLRAQEHQAILDARVPIGYDRYRVLHPGTLVQPLDNYRTERETQGPFRFEGVSEGSRLYR